MLSERSRGSTWRFQWWRKMADIGFKQNIKVLEEKFLTQVEGTTQTVRTTSMPNRRDDLPDAGLPVRAEIAIAQNCLRRAAVAAAHSQIANAKELLANAKRSHRNVIDQISKLGSKHDARSQLAMARILEGEID